MDDLSSKLKKLFKPQPKAFKGKGNVLGRNEQAPEPKKISSTAAPRSRPTYSTAESPKQPIPPGRRLGTAESNVVPERQQAGLSGRQDDRRSTSTPAPITTASVTESYNGAASSQPLPDVEGVDEVQIAAALLLSSDKAPAASEVLGKVLRNILEHPTEAKYRRLRLGNKRIQETIVDVSGGIALLQACGFELVFEAAAEGGSEEGFAVLPDDCDLALVQAALQLLGQPQPSPSSHQQGVGRAASSPASTSSAPAPPSAGPRQRNTQVVLPTGVDDQPLPSWFFSRSPAELKAAFVAKQKKRELDQTLMTRAYREKLAGGQKEQSNSTYAVVRIRLPEGLILQGEFNAGEPVAAVFEWMTDCMRDPGATYELIGPDRKPITAAMGTIRKAQLLPSALLNFQRLSTVPQSEHTLKDELLRNAS
ncbi:probable UBX domain-containing protein 6 [Coccomyxa sp. Obi]|nr:probable UBX domain-containing protein 6 [Coccomyxa sp. Obi]